jgi:hypothetical protein
MIIISWSFSKVVRFPISSQHARRRVSKVCGLVSLEISSSYTSIIFTAAAEHLSLLILVLIKSADFVVGLKNYLDLLATNSNNITSIINLRIFT